MVAGCGGGKSEALVGGDAGADVTEDVTMDAASCPTGQSACGSSCVDTTKDPDNCGSCGNGCTGGQVCSQGVCTLSCAGGTTQCGQSCVETNVDPQNCGSCGEACGPGEACVNGTCTTECPSGQNVCRADGGSYCASLDDDDHNCGACGNACPAGQVCSGGTCGTSCPPTETLCTPAGGAGDAGVGDAGSSYCANTRTDDANCGGCGNVCPQGQVCTAGACTTSCQPNETLCTPDGGAAYCADTQTDDANCGACGDACPAGQACTNGACATSCQPNETLCTPDGGAAYCANTQTDNTNCGACGDVCPAGNVCSGGQCGLTCQSGLTNCNGLCVNEQTDNVNCGACSKTCAAGDVCAMGACTLSCQSGLTDCSGTCTNLDDDPANCGACARACGSNQACAAGKCESLAVCNWDVQAFTWPVTLHSGNFYGGLAFDGNCDMLVAGAYWSDVYRINHLTGAVTTAASGFAGSNSVNGVVYRPSDGAIFVVTDQSPRLFKIVNNAPVLVTAALPVTLSDIALVPTGFGSYGDMLIGAGTNGGVYVINPSAPSVTLIGQTSGTLSDIKMAPDGSLAYVANNTNGTVQTVTAAGTFATFVGGLSQIDGLAMSTDGTMLFATANYDSVQTITIASKTVAAYASVVLDGGYAVSGLLPDGGGHLFVLTSSGGNAVVNHY